MLEQLRAQLHGRAGASLTRCALVSLGVDHLAFTVTDLGVSQRFYTEVLDLNLQRSPRAAMAVP